LINLDTTSYNYTLCSDSEQSFFPGTVKFMRKLVFPDGFKWGVATSAQQIEGAVEVGGRGESIWDRFAARPGNIEDGSNADVACDSYHRFADDLKLIRDMGLSAYRFSIAWPRIQPTGRGAANDAGLDHYERLVDELLAAGVEPYPTLYHWDLPQALQDRGGWATRDIVEWFRDYAALVTARLGDRVKRWVTHNEPWCIATLGHEQGHQAPGHRDPAEALAVAHHLLVSHGHATEAIRQTVRGAEVGIVLVMSDVQARTDSEGDAEAARWYDGFFNRWYMDAVFKGRYPEDAVQDRIRAGHLRGSDLPFVRPGDMEAASVPLDFLGVNYYSRSVLEAGPDGRPRHHIPVPEDELTEMGWEVYPQGLCNGLVRVHEDYAPRRIHITENGAAFPDAPDPDGVIRDGRRIAYLRGHLAAAHEAIRQGVPLGGYFCWSLMDNWEWALGFTKKFGLYAVDPVTQERIAKESARWYGRVARENALPVD
jgi:beta-glucosidase